MSARIMGFDIQVDYFAFEAADGTLFAWTAVASAHRIRGEQGRPDRPLFYAFELRPEPESVRLAQTLAFPTEREAREWAAARWAQAEGVGVPSARTSSRKRPEDVDRHPRQEMDDAADEERATNEGMPEMAPLPKNGAA